MSIFRLSVWITTIALAISTLAVGPQAESLAPSEEQQKLYEQQLAEFERVRLELAEAIGDQQEIYIRYVNREDRTPAARARYLEKRQRVRELFDEAYRKALAVTDTGVLNEQLARFLVTMIQHRIRLDHYDFETFEGAAKMLDAGQELPFLYAAAARSALVAGEFDTAERLFQQLVSAENVSEIDRVLYSNLDQYKQQWEAEQKIRDQEQSEDRLPRVRLKTTQGEVTIELFLDQAPTTVSNFIRLVEQGFYDGLDFFQVSDHALALTGDPAGVGTGNSGKFIKDEHRRDDARKAFRGSLVMAKMPLGQSGKFIPNSASSQFAILFLPVASATDQQTVFGRVIEGMDVVSRLRRVDPNKEKQEGELVLPADSIIEATVIRRPETLPDPEFIER